LAACGIKVRGLEFGEIPIAPPGGRVPGKGRERSLPFPSKNADAFFSFLGFDNPRNFEVRVVHQDDEDEKNSSEFFEER
jgi:hypothetical protein